MSWTATGIYEDEPFTLTWTDEPSGLVSCDAAIYVDLLVLEGESFAVPPTGPSAVLDLTDQASVLIAILDLGSRVVFAGDPPRVGVEVPAGAQA